MKDSIFLVGGIAPPKTSPVQTARKQTSPQPGSQFGKILSAEKKAGQVPKCNSTKEEPSPEKTEPKIAPEAASQPKDIPPANPVGNSPAPGNVCQPLNQAVAEQNIAEEPAASADDNANSADAAAPAKVCVPSLPAIADPAPDSILDVPISDNPQSKSNVDGKEKLAFQAQLGDTIQKSDPPALQDGSGDLAESQKLPAFARPSPSTMPSNPAASQDLSFGSGSKSSTVSSANSTSSEVSAGPKNAAGGPTPKADTPPPVVSGLEKTDPSSTSKNIEPARLAEARPPEVMQQVLQGLEMMVKNKNVSMRLQLYPENLGHIELRVVSNQNGLGVYLRADQPSTQQLLESQAALLKQSLSFAGVNPSQIDFGQGNKNRSYLTRDSWHGARNPSQDLAKDNQSRQPELEVPILGLNGSQNGVDYKI
ncbi:MAG TPA: flagellar hook-length control protein FliK [Anaerolineaceae bacterium]|nr:flagellar hook-length control protein FliK [Anaerolineaceae bacterium]